jgi:hypothetical protein
MGVKMGRTTKEQYRLHYENYQGKPEQIKKRSERNKARREMIAKVGKSALKGKDVDHRKPLRDGGAGTKLSNLRVRTVHANRGDTR